MSLIVVAFAIVGVLSTAFFAYAALGTVILRYRRRPKIDREWDRFEGERFK